MKLTTALAAAGLLALAPSTASAHHNQAPPSTYDDPSAGYYPGDQGGYYDPGVDDELAPPVPEGDEDPGTVPPPAVPTTPVPTSATVPGRTAYMRADGKAAIPRGAPQRVRSVIAAANKIVGKPYKWGGGHRLLVDRGYDCSGAVSYALVGGGLLGGAMVSGQLAQWGAGGAGRWVSVYANKGHVYMEVAGLRFDTSPVGDATGRMGVRWRPVIGKRRGFHARHPLGL